MKILIVNLPFSGHIAPTFGLIKTFVEKGHQVTYILTKAWKEEIETLGAEFVPYDDYPDNLSLIQARRQSFKAAYDTALRIGKDYDCIFYEMIFFMGQELCRRLNKPSVRLFSTFAVNNVIASEVMHTGGLLMRLFSVPLVGRIFTRWLANTIPLPYNNLFEAIVKQTPDYNFVYTTEAFQIDSHSFQDYHFIGPSIIKRDVEQPFDFKIMSAPIIYISLGTLFNRSLSFFKTCIKTFQDRPVTVIMSVGQNINIEKLGKIPSNFHVHRYVPQIEVLKHAKLFITHGGMNSVNEAMYYGVPMVVVPMGADQPLVARQVESLKLGKSLYKKKLTPPLLLDTVQQVLRDSEILASVKSFQEKNQKTNSNVQIERILQRTLYTLKALRNKSEVFILHNSEYAKPYKTGSLDPL